MPADLEMRPMGEQDVEQIPALASLSLGFELPEDAEERKLAERRWTGRMRHAMNTDPAGAWVAERDGELQGVSVAIVREDVWVLSLLVVRPGIQSQGLGRTLLGHALDHGSGVPARMIAASEDPRAIRLYARAGFSLRPTLTAQGLVRREALPTSADGVVEGGEESLSVTEPVSRRLRGGTHAPDLAEELRQDGRLLLAGERGFALSRGGMVMMVAADAPAVAQELLWAALRQSEPDRPVNVRWITAGQDWAVEVMLQAGLDLAPGGPICVSGDPGPMYPYLPSGPYL